MKKRLGAETGRGAEMVKLESGKSEFTPQFVGLQQVGIFARAAVAQLLRARTQ